MTPTPLHCIVLAAGQGTRMKSARPKVLHGVGGRPMLAHVLTAAQKLGAATVHVVHGHGGDAVRAWAEAEAPQALSLHWAHQAEQLGTAHAVQQAMPAIPDDATVIVMYGDVPLVRASTLTPLVDAGRTGLAVLTTTLEDPAGYGRILRDDTGAVIGIVEQRDATPAQQALREINTGFIAAPAGRLRAWLSKIGNDNAKGEYYLTDSVALAVADGVRVEAVRAADASEVEGVNDRLQLAHAERLFQRRQADALMRAGVQFSDPARFELRGALNHGRDVMIDVGCVFEGDVTLDDDVRIGPHCVLRNVTLGPGTVVEAHSVLEHCSAGAGARIGPFARLRPGAALGDDVHVGNFVEVKNVTVGTGSKANHLAYLGDGEVGAGVNIGAGTIFCNYDGANKHRTVIDDGAFIGSDTQLVAPVRVGRDATVAAGSTITRDVPDGGLTLCRARDQKHYPNWQRPTKKKR